MVESFLVFVAHMHHLDESGAVHGVTAILDDRHMHRRVGFFELFSLVIALKHVNLYVLMVQSGNLTV